MIWLGRVNVNKVLLPWFINSVNVRVIVSELHCGKLLVNLFVYRSYNLNSVCNLTGL